jgi:hypothetical protein
MAKLIRLTNPDGIQYLISVNAIQFILPIEGQNSKSKIVLKENATFYAQETIEEILDQTS